MGDSNEFKLNSLDRYVKRSPRLALESHSHCEVPAGCGGVVLQWINAERELRVSLAHFCFAPDPHKATYLTIDGAVPESTRPLLARGAHVLCLEVPAGPGGAALMFDARHVVSASRGAERPGLAIPFACTSAGDGSWLATTAAPSGRWREDPFDDAAWSPLVEVAIARPGEREFSGRYRYDECARRGATPIGLPGATGVLFVRHRFVIPRVEDL